MHSAFSESEISEFDSDDEDSTYYDMDDDNDNINDDDYDAHNELLYPGARLTVGESMTRILQLYLHENMSNACLSQLLSIIGIHCPKGNKCAKTMYFFQKWL